MSKTLALSAALIVFGAASANAYEIRHSYTAEANATEFHGVCNSGDRIVIVRDSAGNFAYRGPAGNGQLGSGANIDDAAKAACAE